MSRGQVLQAGDRVRVERSFGGDNLAGRDGAVVRLRAMNGNQYALVDLAGLEIWILLANVSHLPTAELAVAS